MQEITLEILTVAVSGGAITWLVQMAKRYVSDDIPPKVVAAGFAAILGLSMYLIGWLPEDIKQNIILAVAGIWTSSITFYEVIKNKLK